MKLEDIIKGVKKKTDKEYKRPSAIPSSLHVAKFPTGDKDDVKLRTKRWKDIRKKEKIAKAKMRKLQQSLLEKEREKKKHTLKQILDKTKKVNQLLYMMCTDKAWKYLKSIAQNDPKLYENVFKYLVSPEVVQNVEKIAWDVFNAKKVGKFKEEDKITAKQLLNIYNYFKGIELTRNSV